MQQMNAQLGAIDKKIGELNATLKELPDLQRRYLQLYREVEVKQQLYTALLTHISNYELQKRARLEMFVLSIQLWNQLSRLHRKNYRF
jgi:tyrosine-protein kinase Etk/Wzc